MSHSLPGNPFTDVLKGLCVCGGPKENREIVCGDCWHGTPQEILDGFQVAGDNTRSLEVWRARMLASAAERGRKRAVEQVCEWIKTELFAGMAVTTSKIEQKVWNQAHKRAIDIVTNYQKGEGLFQITGTQHENTEARNQK